MQFKVAGGEYNGRLIFDNLVFSDKGKERVKLLAECIGINTEGKKGLGPNELLIDKKVILTVVTESYVDKDGKEKKKNTVTFAGYKEYGEGNSDTANGETSETEDYSEVSIPF